MPEIRYSREYTNGSLTKEISYEVSDEELLVEAVEAETDLANDDAMINYAAWDNLTPPARVAIIKMLLGDFISRNRSHYI